MAMMKQVYHAAAFVLLAGPALAGGMAEPVMAPTVIEEGAASSGSDDWVGILMLIAVIGAVASN